MVFFAQLVPFASEPLHGSLEFFALVFNPPDLNRLSRRTRLRRFPAGAIGLTRFVGRMCARVSTNALRPRPLRLPRRLALLRELRLLSPLVFFGILPRLTAVHLVVVPVLEAQS